MGMASPQHSNYLGCLEAMRAPHRILIIAERFLMITFCSKTEEQNMAYFPHIPWALVNKYSLCEGPHGCSAKKYLSPYRRSNKVRVNVRLHFGCGTAWILYDCFQSLSFPLFMLNTSRASIFYKQQFLRQLSTYQASNQKCLCWYVKYKCGRAFRIKGNMIFLLQMKIICYRLF